MKKIGFWSLLYGIIIFVVYPMLSKLYVMSYLFIAINRVYVLLFRLTTLFIIVFMNIIFYGGYKKEYIEKGKFSYRKNLLLGSFQALMGVMLTFLIFYVAYMILSQIDIFYKYHAMFRVIHLFENTDINAHIHIIVLLLIALFMNAVCITAATKKAKCCK